MTDDLYEACAKEKDTALAKLTSAYAELDALRNTACDQRDAYKAEIERLIKMLSTDRPALGRSLSDEFAKAKAEIERLRGLITVSHLDDVLVENQQLRYDLGLERHNNERLRGEMDALQTHFDIKARLGAEKDAEIERLRTYIAEIEKWKADGERMIGPASEFGMNVPSSTLFKLGNWWADRPWRTKDIPYCASCGKQKERCDGC